MADDGWSVVSTAPAQGGDAGGDDWSVVSHKPAKAPSMGDQLSSVAGGFIGESLHNLNPVNLAQGAYQMLRHPIDTLSADSAARDAEMQKSAEGFNNGDYLEGATRYLTGAVPVLGPMAGRVYDAIEHGTPKEMGSSVADITSLKTVPKFYGGVAKLGVKGVGRVLRPVQGTESEAAAAARDLNIPVGASDFTNTTRGPRMVENFVANRALGRQPIFEFKQKQNAAANVAAHNIAGKMGEQYTPMESGTAVRDILNSQDEANMKSLLDTENARVSKLNAENQAKYETDQAAENTRAARVNAENQAKTRAVEKVQGDLNAQRQAAQANALSDLHGTVSELGPLNSSEATGAAFHSGMQSEANAFRSQARDIYSKLDEATGAATVNITPIKDFMNQLSRDLKGVGGATAALKGVDTQKLLQTAKMWNKAAPMATFADAQDILSSLKSIGRDYGSLIKTRYPGAIGKLTGMLENEMQTSASKAGALDLYRQAQNFYKQGVGKFNDSFAADLMNKNPEDVAESIWKPGAVTPIKEVQSALAGQPEIWRAIQRRGVEDLFESSLKDGTLDAGKLKANWNKLGPEVQKAMTGDKWKTINQQILHYDLTHAPLSLEPPPSFKTEKPSLLSAPKEIKPETPKLQFNPQQQAIRTLAARRPESIADQLLTPGAESMATELRSALKDHPDLFDSVRRQTFERLISSNSKPPVAGGSPIIEARALVRQWRDLGPQMQSVIAGDQLPLINKFMSAVNGLNFEKLHTLHNAIYGGVLDPIAAMGGTSGAVMGGLSHDPMAAMASAAGAATWLLAPKYIAKAMTSLAGVKWLTEGLRIPAKSADAAKWMAKGGAIAGVAGNQTKQNKATLPAPPVKGLPAPPSP